MTPDKQLRALQLEGLRMASYIYDFCKRNDLLIYFCGGCCIGALRHGGFVPWDDDVDYFMPREDYERFVRLWQEQEKDGPYVLVKSDENLVDRNLFLTIRNPKTTFIKTYQQDLTLCHGVAVDILPLDGYPDSPWARKRQMMWALIYSLFCAQTVPVNHGGVMALGSRVLLSLVRSPRLRYRIWMCAQRHMTQWKIEDCSGITELCSVPHYMKNRYEKAWFASAVEKEFEGIPMPLPVGYDAYLHTVFGEYMQLPPPEKQVPSHEAVCIDLEHPYTEHADLYGEQAGISHAGGKGE